MASTAVTSKHHPPLLLDHKYLHRRLKAIKNHVLPINQNSENSILNFLNDLFEIDIEIEIS
ncbi:hypothetical protein BpHYR1_025103 [Brachionus plicatilis]|uniref:Uncharacterized protein n=1 Tax=Brachionus plicatilis TaxID=10195 RepID=A0A3M7RGG5_BRAPC|nr:hypothetical protein BpHYR1_025103 [Brachionus plicatilis]